MRALKLLGLAEDGASLVCEDPKSGELFAVPAPERLPAAPGANDSLTAQRRPGPKDTQMEPQLRPREIQTRIRAGASLEQVAQEAGCEPSRIERFAYPVLMERSTIADRARLARPIVDGTPAKMTVEKLVLETLAARGQAASVQWDAYRTDAGSWVLLLTWNAGRSENTARWTYHAGAAGGSLTALDGAAGEIIDPAPRPLRTVPEAVVEEPPAPPVNPLATQHTPDPAEPQRRPEPAARTSTPTPAAVLAAPARAPQARTGTNKVAAALAHHAVSSPTTQAAEAVRADARADTSVARTGTDDPGRPGRRGPMPSWEDVLLGVRSPGR